MNYYSDIFSRQNPFVSHVRIRGYDLVPHITRAPNISTSNTKKPHHSTPFHVSAFFQSTQHYALSPCIPARFSKRCEIGTRNAPDIWPMARSRLSLCIIHVENGGFGCRCIGIGLKM